MSEIDRQCHQCAACCRILEITDPDLNKAYGEPCPHLERKEHRRRYGACTIYERRPETCRRFRCLWLDGLGTNADRPDTLGAIWTAQDNPKAPHGAWMIVYTFRDTPDGAARVAEVAQGMFVYEKRPDKTEVVHTPQGSAVVDDAFREAVKREQAKG